MEKSLNPCDIRPSSKKVFVTSRTIKWPNGADFAPEFLFEVAQLSKKPIVSCPPKDDIMELHGLGADIWKDIDAQEYVNNLREEWNE